MVIFEKLRSITRSQAIFLALTVLCMISFLVLFIDPSTRKGPLGFGPPAPMILFQMKDKSFTLLYPENWVAAETPQGNHGDIEIIAVIIVSGKQMANITIARKPFPTGNISNVVNWGQSRAAMHTDHNILSFKPLSDNNLDGLIQEYTWGSPSFNKNVTSHCQDVYIFHNADGYALSFCALQQDWPSLMNVYAQIRQSFSIQGVNK